MLVGVVTDTEGMPVAGAEVELDGRRRAITAMDGRFALARVRRGELRLVVRRAGYETAELVMSFVDRRQMAFARLVSRAELIDRAVGALAGGDLPAAEAALERARALDDPSTDADLSLITAVLHYRRGESGAARRVLEPLLEDPSTRKPASRLLALIADTASGSR
jgi:hypothetical protein